MAASYYSVAHELPGLEAKRRHTPKPAPSDYGLVVPELSLTHNHDCS
jgi:hypothetical protein